MLSKVAFTPSLQCRPCILIRQFSHVVGVERVYGALKIHQSEAHYYKTGGVGGSLSMWSSSRGNTRQFQRVSNPVAVRAQTGIFIRSITSLTLKTGSNDVIYEGNFSSTSQKWTRKSFSTNAVMAESQEIGIPENQELGMPEYQEIGMPPLCLTRNEVNIVKWVKKVGDRVYPGDVICEVETDIGTLELETIEDGYLAKIIIGDGAQGIKPGEVIAVAVEEEIDVEKFKNYEVSESGSAVPGKKLAWKIIEENLDMPECQEIGMPPLSLTTNEVNIVKWVRKVGDRVYPGDVICEVQTDRYIVEMETITDGYLAKIIKGDGAQRIKPGEVIGITVDEEADIQKLKNYERSKSGCDVPEPHESSEPEASEIQRSEAPSLSPVVAAEDNNVSLSSVKGTGIDDGSTVKANFEDNFASRGNKVSDTTTKVAERVGQDFTDIPHTQIRKVTAARLLMAKQTIPHYYLTVDTCVDKLMELRSQLNSLQEASGGMRISVNDLVIKAAALALKKVPACNSSWTDDYIRQYHDVNINVAVQTDNGLYVAVVRDADKKGLSKISEEVKTLAQKARENSLKPEEYEGGTFTVSNLGGPFRIKQFCAVINPPQAAILAVGTAVKRAVPGYGADLYNFASFMSVTLSCDHRVIDGAIGAEWLKAFKGYIENPESMML